jgi:hypothetical protein
MKRRLALLLPTAAVATVGGIAVISPASSAPGRADLTVGALNEPPETGPAGSRFGASFAVVNQGPGRARKKTVTRFFLDRTPDNKKGRRSVGKKSVRGMDGQNEQNARARLRIPRGLADGEYHLVACADAGKKVRESKEGNNCRISGQTLGVGQTRIGPPGPAGGTSGRVLQNIALPLGRATLPGTEAAPGDDEKSDRRAELASAGPIRIVADCKRTSNGDDGEADAPFGTPNAYDEDGDEAKILVYTDRGTLTFNGPGASSRRNIPPGEGAPEDDDPGGGYTQADETNGGEGAHMAIAAARDPDQAAPGARGGASQGTVAFAYKVKTIYISHSNGTELIFTGFAGIDILGAEDSCVFGGVLRTVRVVG